MKNCFQFVNTHNIREKYLVVKEYLKNGFFGLPIFVSNVQDVFFCWEASNSWKRKVFPKNLFVKSRFGWEKNQLLKWFLKSKKYLSSSSFEQQQSKIRTSKFFFFYSTLTENLSFKGALLKVLMPICYSKISAMRLLLVKRPYLIKPQLVRIYFFDDLHILFFSCLCHIKLI